MPIVENNYETWQDYLHGTATVRNRARITNVKFDAF